MIKEIKVKKKDGDKEVEECLTLMKGGSDHAFKKRTLSVRAARLSH